MKEKSPEQGLSVKAGPAQGIILFIKELYMAEDEKISETSTISMSVKICGRTTSFTMKKNI